MSNSKIINQEKGTKYTKITYVAIILLVLFFVSGFIPLFYIIGFPAYLFNNKVINVDLINLSNLGQFLSGTSGILFSLAAIMAVVVAFLIQRTQIKLQKEQIRLQKVEINDGKIKDEILHFENNFYQLLKIHRNILESIGYSYYSHSFGSFTEQHLVENTGINAIKTYYDRDFFEIIRDFTSTRTSNIQSFNEQENFNEAYNKFIKNNSNALGHYFRSLYHILKLIYINRNILKDGGKFYSNIIRAQISSVELVFIFFNGVSNIAEYKSTKINYKSLIEYFMFFEHLNLIEFIDEQYIAEREAVLNLINLYNKSAYGDKYDEIIKSFNINN